MTRVDENGRIFLEGPSSARLQEWSVYLRRFSQKDYEYLFELSGPAVAGGPMKDPDARYDIFLSSGAISKKDPDKIRKRVQIASNVSPERVVPTIQHTVIRKCASFQAELPPAWWKDIPKSDLEQIALMHPKTSKSRGYEEHIEAAYKDPNYWIGLHENGYRCKAHFVAGSETVRFDNWGISGTTGLAREMSAFPVVGTCWTTQMRELLVELNGTVLELECTHPMGNTNLFRLLDMTSEESLAFQSENGLVKVTIVDCLTVKGQSIQDLPYHERVEYAKAITEKWKAALVDDRRSSLLSMKQWWPHEEKDHVRDWAKSQSYDGLELRNALSAFRPNGRTWDWVHEINGYNVFGIITGFQDGQSAAHAPRQLVKSIQVSQFDKGGALVEVAVVSSMSDTLRDWVSTYRDRAQGSVVILEVDNQDKRTNKLVAARVLGFDMERKPEVAVLFQEGV